MKKRSLLSALFLFFLLLAVGCSGAVDPLNPTAGTGNVSSPPTLATRNMPLQASKEGKTCTDTHKVGDVVACIRSGSLANAWVGRCRPGTQKCGTDGKWTACSGGTMPTQEICDGNGNLWDNDCDGQVDEGLVCANQCTPGDTMVCYTGPAGTRDKGICKAGHRVCGSNGAWGACGGTFQGPQVEVCDGKDNDCDGHVDEGCLCKDGDTRACGSDTGECKKGTQTCSSGKWGACSDTKPTTEKCDGKDNNCNGQVDDVAQSVCGTGKACISGSCQVVAAKCVKDTKRICYTGPSGTRGKGTCKAGYETCLADGSWTKCSDVVPAAKDNCSTFTDNTCDGKVACACQAGKTRVCRTICEAGTQTCKSDGSGWTDCSARKPSTELCDGLDNDCDGKVDEDFKLGSGCSVGYGICWSVGKFVCSKDKKSAECKPDNVISPQPETCDGKDNDCDGLVDEQLTQGCKTACGTGKEVCEKGKWVRCDAPKPAPETCDNRDNNCNNQVDEDTCPAGYVCAGPISMCVPKPQPNPPATP